MRQGFSWQVRERMRERGAGEGRWKGEGRQKAGSVLSNLFSGWHHLAVTWEAGKEHMSFSFLSICGKICFYFNNILK